MTKAATGVSTSGKQTTAKLKLSSSALLLSKQNQLEQTSNNWASFARSTAPSNELKQRSTMTNFAKRSMIEQSFVQSIPSEGPARRHTKMMN